MAAPDYLVLNDLYAMIGPARVNAFFDEDGDGTLDTAEATVADTILRQAEAQLYSKMLRSWSRAEVILLANNDEVFKGHAVWVALELASERRPEFTTPEGKGQFYLQYERAIQYADDLSKNKARSVGETAAGVPGTRGGSTTPQIETPNPTFVFTPSKDYPSGHGSF